MTVEEIREAVRYAHARNVRCHLALNVYAHNEDILPLQEYLRTIRDIPVDAYIVSDLAVMQLLRDDLCLRGLILTESVCLPAIK